MYKEEIINNLKNIKKAVDVEIKYRYVDLEGKKYTFSRYIFDELRKINKIDPNIKWKNLYNIFEKYSMTDVPSRISAVRNLNEIIEDYFHPDKEKDVISCIAGKNPEDLEITYIKGVGPRVSFLLNKLGVFTADDLLHYYPRKHLDYASRAKIRNLQPGQEVTIYGTIISVRIFQSKNRSNLTIINIMVEDETGIISASWFNAGSNKFVTENYRAKFKQGMGVILSGIVKLDNFSGRKIIDKPQAETLSGEFGNEEVDSLNLARIVPVYNLTENLNVKTVRKAIYNTIESYAEKIQDFLPLYIKEKHSLIDKITAIKQIHFPDSLEHLEEAKKRLIFDELFLAQLHLALMRKEYEKNESLILNVEKQSLVRKLLASLPFKLTNAQKRAFNEILTNLSSNKPMQRLLQGDVGSGKTLVACMTLLMAVENGYQGAIMAPTEILAEQHYRNFVQWLTPLGLSVGLFIGRHGVKIRREQRQNLKNGQIDIAVGTHALIQEGVEFNNLGLIVIDEQHRFGVRQRSELKNKGNYPEMLTMTATPIPRTLALTLHGDLDLTIIDELPPGRKPIKTALIPPKDRKKAYDLIRKEIEKGRQAYIVFPLIEESETLSAKAAVKEAERLQNYVFPDLNIGLVHGKLPSNEKDDAMEAFRKGDFHILVSTTVIEVGVDVPNATVMVIEDAERFGLSQLHQLRGRVGRDKKQSYCVLVANTKSPETKERLEIMTQTNDGFIIAEKDLQIRGPGEFTGTRQSGLPDFVLADLVKNADILELARDEAFEFVKNNDITNYPILTKKVYSKINEGIDMINAG